MITTTVKEVSQGLLRPIFQISLGPKYHRQKSVHPEEAYGYLWVMVMDPATNAFHFYQVRHNQLPYNWAVRQDIPSSITLSNMITLYVPEPNDIDWASFAFDNEGELYLAVRYRLPGGTKISVFDPSGTEVMELSGAKEPFLVPEYFLNRAFHDGKVYLLYLPSNDSNLSYVSVPDSEETGIVSTIPVNARSGLKIVDYAYRELGLELIYATQVNSLVYIEVEGSQMDSQELKEADPYVLLERARRAYRVSTITSTSPLVGSDRIAKVLLIQESDAARFSSQHTSDKVAKILLTSEQDFAVVSPSFSEDVVAKVFYDHKEEHFSPHHGHSLDRISTTHFSLYEEHLSPGHGHVLDKIPATHISLYEEQVMVQSGSSVDLRENSFPDRIADGYVSGYHVNLSHAQVSLSLLPEENMAVAGGVSSVLLLPVSLWYQPDEDLLFSYASQDVLLYQTSVLLEDRDSLEMHFVHALELRQVA